MVRFSLSISNVERMKDERPFAFEVDRGDGERLKVLYTRDCFFQLQESLSETSVFVGKSIMKGKSLVRSISL